MGTGGRRGRFVSGAGGKFEEIPQIQERSIVSVLISVAVVILAHLLISINKS